MFERIATIQEPCWITDSSGKAYSFTATIEISIAPDDQAPDFDYGNEYENSREMKRFETGELLNLTVRVHASAYGLEGTDYLGQCFVKASNLNQDVLDLVRDHAVITTAVDELTGEMKRLAVELKHLA